MKDEIKGAQAFEGASKKRANEAKARGRKQREAINKKERPASKGRVHKGRTRS